MNLKRSAGAIDINSYAKKVQVDHRLPLRYYYRIADSLIKQVTARSGNPISLTILDAACASRED